MFCPTSTPLAAVIASKSDKTSWGEWDPKTVEGSLDNMEKTVRKFGGGAAKVCEPYHSLFNISQFFIKIPPVADFHSRTSRRLVQSLHCPTQLRRCLQLLWGIIHQARVGLCHGSREHYVLFLHVLWRYKLGNIRYAV